MRGHPPLLETPKRGILTVTRPTKPENEIYLIPKIGGNRARREEPRSSQPDSDELFEMASLFPRTTRLPMTVWVSPRGS